MSFCHLCSGHQTFSQGMTQTALCSNILNHISKIHWCCKRDLFLILWGFFKIPYICTILMHLQCVFLFSQRVVLFPYKFTSKKCLVVLVFQVLIEVLLTLYQLLLVVPLIKILCICVFQELPAFLQFFILYIIFKSLSPPVPEFWSFEIHSFYAVTLVFSFPQDRELHSLANTFNLATFLFDIFIQI